MHGYQCMTLLIKKSSSLLAHKHHSKLSPSPPLVMNFERKFSEELNLEDGIPLKSSSSSSSSKGCYDFHNLDPLVPDSKLGIPASDFYPLGAPTSVCMSDFDTELPKIFSDGMSEKFQPGNLMGYHLIVGAEPIGQYPNHAPDSPCMEPMNFVFPDEMSCVTGNNGMHGKVGVNKKSMQITRKGTNQKESYVVRGQWTMEEDRLLVCLVQQLGLKKWADIAKMFKGRIGKQCRERWYNHLRPNIKRESWSEEEDLVLIKFHQVVGNKWAEIAKRLPGRTENSIKNHWNTTRRRQFSRRKCRSSKNPKPNMFLQNYITSIMKKSLAGHHQKNPSNVAAMSRQAPKPQTHDSGHGERLVPEYDLDDILDLPIEPADSLVEICGSNGGPLFDDMTMMTVMMPSGLDVGGESCMGMDVALEVESFMQSQNVKRELDLVEMITQTNNKI